jgi:uncharacterized protein (TIRG00374 family)
MSNTRRIVVRIAKLALAGALLYFIFRVVPFREVLQTLRSAQPGMALVGLGLLFGARLIAASRMKILTDKQGLVFSLSEIFEISTTATFYGLVLPGIVSGGLIRWYKLARQGQSVGALASLTWDRLADATSVAVIGVACWLLSRPADVRTTLGPVLLAACIGLVCLYLTGFSRRVGALLFPRIESAAGRLRSEWARTRVAKVAAAGRRYHQAEADFPLRVAVLSLASQLVGLAAFACWSRSLSMSVGFAELGWARSCYLLTVLLPITFAGLGAREGILILLLRPYGVTGAEAVALAFLQLGGTLTMAALGGLFELRRLWPLQRSTETRGSPAPLEEDS